MIGVCLALVVLVSAIGLAAQPADENVAEFSSGPARVDLIELFTSEGCSSCPPAERWLNGLSDRTRLFRDYVPLAFHVDYWDYIGWSDRFADTRYSARQRRYAAEGGVNTVYTPGMFLNGHEWRAWRRLKEPRRREGNAGTLSAAITESGYVHVRYVTPVTAPGELRANVALLGSGLTTAVGRGENAGRELKHDFVVLGLGTVVLQGYRQERSARLRLPAPELDAPRHAVAVWVSPGNRQAPVQATGGYLP